MQLCRKGILRLAVLLGCVLLVSGIQPTSRQVIVAPKTRGSYESHAGDVIVQGGSQNRDHSTDEHATVGDAHGHHESHGGHADAHGNGHGNSHGGHGDAHGHGAADSASLSMAFMLLGTVGWVMSLFYFVNWPDKDVRQATWDTLSTMICIFCAVLIFSSTKEILVDFAGENSGGHHDPPDTKSLGLSIVRFFSLQVLFEVLSWMNRNSFMHLKYVVSVGGHVVGFAAIDLFGSILQLPLFSSSLFFSIIGFGVMCVIFVAIFHPLHLFRTSFNAEKYFSEACSEADIESIGLCAGLIMSMLIRFAITGHIPPVHGAPWEKTTVEVSSLFLCSLLLCPLVMIASVLRFRLPETASPMRKKSAEVMQESFSMTVGWCLLYWGYWNFCAATDDANVDSRPMSMRLVMALIFSAMSFAAILSIDALADRSPPALEAGLRALLKTSGVVMGLSWEASFTQAEHSIGASFDFPIRTFVKIGITFGLCAVVLPAWALYILPKTTACQPEKADEQGNLKTP